jgi:hypothetical protein
MSGRSASLVTSKRAPDAARTCRTVSPYAATLASVWGG